VSDQPRLTPEKANAIAQALLGEEHERCSHWHKRLVPFWYRSADSQRLHPRVEFELYRQVRANLRVSLVIGAAFLALALLVAVTTRLGSRAIDWLWVICILMPFGISWDVRRRLARLARETLAEPAGAHGVMSDP
jgi:hypothetical protein